MSALFRTMSLGGEIGREIGDGLRELKRGRSSRVLNASDLANVREKTALSQSVRGDRSVPSKRRNKGEQHRSGAARTLLVIADRNPPVLLDVA
jgi:putative transcriptional regulator